MTGRRRKHGAAALLTLAIWFTPLSVSEGRGSARPPTPDAVLFEPAIDRPETLRTYDEQVAAIVLAAPDHPPAPR